MSSEEVPPHRFCVNVITLFPEFILQAVSHSILGRAIAAGIVDIRVINPRDYSTNKHKMVDDYPFGGGAGMVMKYSSPAGGIPGVTVVYAPAKV